MPFCLAPFCYFEGQDNKEWISWMLSMQANDFDHEKALDFSWSLLVIRE